MGDKDPLWVKDRTGLFFTRPVEKGFLNDQGCCGPIGCSIFILVIVLAYLLVRG